MKSWWEDLCKNIKVQSSKPKYQMNVKFQKVVEKFDHDVTPAKAGVHMFDPFFSKGQAWIPVSTGMKELNTDKESISSK